MVVIRTEAPETLQRKILARFKLKSQLVDGTMRIERPRGHELVRELVDAFGDEIESVSFGKPTLEDVFVHLTGHQFFAHTLGDGEAAMSEIFFRPGRCGGARSRASSASAAG